MYVLREKIKSNKILKELANINGELKMYPLDKTTRSAGFHASWCLLVGV